MGRMSFSISSHLKAFCQKVNCKIWQISHKIEKEIEKHLISRTALGGYFRQLDF